MSTVSRIRRSDSPFHDPVQSPRFIKLKCNWFFLTREKGMHGPFETQIGAETALEVFLEDLSTARLKQPENRPQSTYTSTPKYQVDEISIDNILPWKKANWKSHT